METKLYRVTKFPGQTKKPRYPVELYIFIAKYKWGDSRTSSLPLMFQQEEGKLQHRGG